MDGRMNNKIAVAEIRTLFGYDIKDDANKSYLSVVLSSYKGREPIVECVSSRCGNGVESGEIGTCRYDPIEVAEMLENMAKTLRGLVNNE